MVSELADSAADVRAEFFARQERRIERLLRAGIKQRSFALTSPKLAARAIEAALQGVEREVVAQSTPADARKLMEQMVQVLLFGLLGPRRPAS